MKFNYDIESKEFDFSEAENHLFPLELEILDEVIKNVFVPGRDSIANTNSPFRSNTHWTNQILKCFYDIGTRNGFLCYPQSKGNNGWAGEWMLDHVWLDCGNSEENGQITQDWKDLRGVKLGMECEWNPSLNNILEDFQKLVHFICEIRVFIYEKRDIYSKENVKLSQVQEMKRACRLSSGHRFLTIGYPPKIQDKFIEVNSWIA